MRNTLALGNIDAQMQSTLIAQRGFITGPHPPNLEGCWGSNNAPRGMVWKAPTAITPGAGPGQSFNKTARAYRGVGGIGTAGSSGVTALASRRHSSSPALGDHALTRDGLSRWTAIVRLWPTGRKGWTLRGFHCSLHLMGIPLARCI